MAIACSAVGFVLAVWVSAWPPAQTAALVLLLAAVAVAGAVSLRAPARMSPALVVAALMGGTGFLSLGMVIAGPEAVRGADNEMLFLAPVVFSAYFCRAWVVALVTGTASTTYAAALLALDLPSPAAPWLTTTSALVMVAALVRVTRARDVELLAATAEQALHDPLTGLLNRRGLVHRSADWPGGDVCALLVDLDHFKAVNDDHGHLVGDQVLVLVGQALSAGLRTIDVVARYGGEEFVLLLPGCSAAEGSRRAQELRERVERESAAWPVVVRLSVGVAAGRRDEVDLPGLLAAADRALYAAKSGGRNTVRVEAPVVCEQRPPSELPVQPR